MTYFEQADVNHLNEMVVVIYTTSGVHTFASTKALNDIVASPEANTLSPSFSVRIPFKLKYFTDLKPESK